MARTRVAGVLAVLVLGWTGMAGAQGTAWLHVTVETRGASGEQVSTFRAFTTSDQAGTQRIPVDRLCVKGIAHQDRGTVRGEHGRGRAGRAHHRAARRGKPLRRGGGVGRVEGGPSLGHGPRLPLRTAPPSPARRY